MPKIGAVAQKRRLERLKRLKGIVDKLEPPPPRPLAVSVAEFAHLTGLSAVTIWRAVKAKQVKSSKFRDRVIIPYSEVERVCGIEPQPAAAADQGEARP